MQFRSYMEFNQMEHRIWALVVYGRSNTAIDTARRLAADEGFIAYRRGRYFLRDPGHCLVRWPDKGRGYYVDA